MNTRAVNKSLIINNVPLEEIKITQTAVEVRIDDINERRYCITFKPYQAVKVITSDCFDKSILLDSDNYSFGRYKRYILEALDSEWINMMKSTLKSNDENAVFLETARHFILDLGDNILEIISTDIEIKEESI